MAIIDVIKYNGTPDLLIWKYPSEELGNWTQIIVNESQEAILYKEGKAWDIFQSGRHTLDTANIPLLSKIINLPFGGRSPFTAEVWYVNKTVSLDVKWGTATPIQIQDPKYQIFCSIRANGIFGIQIDDSRKCLVKLIGTLSAFDKPTMVKFFRGLCITKAKDAISSYMVKKQISILEINAYIDELSAYMKERIEPEMEEYGIKLVNFYVNDISVSEDDSSVKKLKDALAKRAEMNIIDYNYQQKRSFDTLEKAAENSETSALTNTAIGLGMGRSIGKVFGDMAQAINPVPSKMKECPNCHEKMGVSQRFCGTCGFDTESELNKIKSEENKTIIICRMCGTAISGNAKFCPECGSPLINKCPKCGHVIEGNPKFCSECGEQLLK